MYLLFSSFILIYFGINVCDGGYGIGQDAQSDVQAPAYVPAYLKNQKFTPSNYGTGRKTVPTGTKTGYTGTKTVYTGTKTGYTRYSGTKTVHSNANNGYAERKSWNTDYGRRPDLDDFQTNANQQYEEKCNPECKNNGICVALNTCQCPSNFRGKYCEFERKPCLVYPPLPMNSQRNCSSEFCTIKCMDGHKFVDGTTVANMRCADGQWQPTRADFSTIPDCLPQCSPPCLNGGVCLAQDTCQCPEDFRGPQCQYPLSVCDIRKLAFNGGYSCFGDMEKFSCKLNCPAGSSYSSPNAELYVCQYSSGIFLPQPIPHCVFNDVAVIVPSKYHNESSYSESHTSWTSESHGGSSGSHMHVVVQDHTPKEGTCLSWAGVHYKTFDGKIYSFQSGCRHVLVRDSRHKVAVVARAGTCERHAYCPSELTIYIQDKPYTLSVHPEDGSVLFRSGRRLVGVPAALPGLRVAMPADRVLVSLDAAGLYLTWDTNNLITIESSIVLWNNTEGLCGSLNGNVNDDLTTKEGTRAKTAAAMASSWQMNAIDDICEKTPSEYASCSSQSYEIKRKSLEFCSKIFSKDKFRKCSEVIDVSLLLEACQADYCACASSKSSEECACGTVAVYAKECLRHGVEDMKYWRDPDTCPKTCPDGKLYQVCGPEIQATCAGAATGVVPAVATNSSSCVEGCFCPEGLYLEGGRCLPLRECPCRLRNKLFKPGSVIPKDCNTCKCSNGAWSCSGAACGARCGAVGDPHYVTFDGRRFDFMGRCSYTLLRTHNLTVDVDNVACSGAITEAMNLSPYKGGGKPSCTKAVNLNYAGAHIHLKQGGLILVNGQEVSTLPVSVAGMRIRAASSLFVIIQLPIGVDLWWDGNTRVFVDVPPGFQGKTKGLCGTFNMNQQDDFLTPEGDIEQSTLAFANKWKTREFCEDLDTQEPEHPCKANMQNKEAAEKYCSKLKSKLFDECHWYVDVEPFYEACVYDMCACSGAVGPCLCPVLAEYADVCAAAGPRPQWRYHVKECELQCTGGQEYTVCADSCLRTCTDLALSTTGQCKPRCVEGCACPIGQLLDDNNSCVPQGLCSCNHKGMKFDAGYKEVRPGRRERELCTCVGGRWECVPATDADIQKYPPAEDLRHNCSAAKHMEFTTCQLAEPLTCKNMHLAPRAVSGECRAGCACARGLVLDAATGQCVPPASCPCHHAARSYRDGDTIQEDCNQCVCKGGNWTCTQRVCAGECSVWGDSHVGTFDSAEFDFEGVCTYLLAKGAMDSNDGFDIEIQNVPCGTTGATCSKTTTLKVGGSIQEIVSLTKDAPIPDVSKLKRIKLREAGEYVFVDVPSLGVTVQWDRGMRVYVKLASAWRGRVRGLCGNFNGDQRDDFKPPRGALPEPSPSVFVDSWKLKPTCPNAKPVEDYCALRPERREWASSVCGALKRLPFAVCGGAVEAGAHVARCERAACACDAGGDCACACAALAHYAHACAQKGITFNWRTPELCPMQCDEECSHYDSCMSPCPEETCDNVVDFKDIKASCEQETCIEGCKRSKPCPDGQVYSNSSLSSCVPRTECRSPCMTLEDGTVLLEGELIEEDACHQCRCSKNQKLCTGQPCSTEPPSPRSHDEPLKCKSGWTSWLSRHTPQPGPDGVSVEIEPLPELKELKIGTPMCSKLFMADIECRTKLNHETPKQTGLDVECSLERGLVCREPAGTCPDFELRVRCDCEAFQCLNSTRPSYQHPSDCSQFYECTPQTAASDRPHAVLKTCSPGTLYNPETMICDWPAVVLAIRPGCDSSTTASTISSTSSTSTTSTTTRTTITTETSSSTEGTWTVQSTTEGICPPGQVYLECAYPCDQLCDHFKKTLVQNGTCLPGEDCIGACVDAAVAEKGCDRPSRWRDHNTCVPLKDCTCYSDGNIVKPGGVVAAGCVKCQCLANDLHCDSSGCSSPATQRSQHLIVTEPPITTEAPTTPTTSTPSSTIPSTTPSTTTTPLIIINTASPPPECAPSGYKYLLWAEDASPKPIFTASSIASPQFEPEFSIIDGRPNELSAGSWNPKTNDRNQYIQVELPHFEPIHGVVLQGSPLFDQFVSSYELMYGDDGNVFSYVTQPDGKPTVFRGPVDHNTAQKQMISPPIEAKFLRLKPLTWHDDIAVRWQIIGCEEPLSSTTEYITSTPPSDMCTEPLGLEGGLPVEQVEVSSNNDKRSLLPLSSDRGWTPLYSTPGEWLMFDFTSPRNITGIKTKGGPQGWVAAYKVMYTSDLSVFNPVLTKDGTPKLFPANFDQDSEVHNSFRLPIHARYLKVLPVKWHDGIEMRIEPVGCFEPYPTSPTPSPVEVVTPTCAVCPGVVAEQCACAAGAHFDGASCVPRDQCPCVLGYTTYPVGSSYRGENCDECMCKLGGVTDCQPVKQCVCAPSLVPKLVPMPSCECVCTPCPAGTRICPTSKLCLSVDKWCDGLQDCPDDERDCTTSSTSTTTTTTPTQPNTSTTAIYDRSPSTTTAQTTIRFTTDTPQPATSTPQRTFVTIEPEVVTTVVSTVGLVPTTPSTTLATTAKPLVCPEIQCPPGYILKLISKASHSRSYTSDLPPPRPRYSYQRYYRGAKGGFSKGGYSKGGYSKTAFSKGGYGGSSRPLGSSQAFTLDKPSSPKVPEVQECPQFRCVAGLPPPPRPGAPPTTACSTPRCPPHYSLHLDSVSSPTQCPQYSCIPPPERPSFCNVTGDSVSTLDGAEYKYPLCYHILARDHKTDAWSVLVRKKCRVDGCLNELIVHQDDQLIKVKPSLLIEYDNYEYTVEQTAKICFQKNSFDVAKIGDGLSIKSRRYNFTVYYNTDGDIKIGVPKSFMGSVDGLCGWFDGSPRNERLLPDGEAASSASQMARAWGRPGLPPAACQPRLVDEARQRRAWELCKLISEEPLSKCGKVLNLDKWRNICLEKICKCTDLIVNGTKKTEEECRCLVVEKMVAECLAAASDVDVTDWRIKLNCPAECPAGLVHRECYRARCEPACGAAVCPPTAGHCFPGCYCPDGTLRDGGRCLPPHQCRDCVCKSAGAPAELTSFEGNSLPPLGNCTYLASRDSDQNNTSKYEVYMKNGPCEDNNNLTCVKTIHLIHEKNVIHISKDLASKELITTIGNDPVFKYPMKNEWVTISQINGKDVSVFLQNVYVEVVVQQRKLEFSINVPSSVYAHRTSGACGRCGDSDVRLRTADGNVTDDLIKFGESWRASANASKALGITHAQCGVELPAGCVRAPPDSDACLVLYNPDIFGKCHALVDPEPFVESCEEEQCARNSSDACASAARYAAACRQLGVCLRWRTEQLCPFPCENPFVYRPCVDCERTCENHDDLEKNPSLCQREPDEGCFCPEGKVRVNNTCIEPTKCFPCDTEKLHYVGDEWQEDACKKCTCSRVGGDVQVSCSSQTCGAPLCGEGLRPVPSRLNPTACCTDYLCMEIPQSQCKEPKMMECGFGQVLKQKTNPSGCKEFICECKPAEECEQIPSESEVEMLQPGMVRVVDRSGCCPRARVECRPQACPRAPHCPPPRVLRPTPTDCCTRYTCEIPEDKCLAILEWEASPKGGEIPRAKPEEILKDVEESWMDGPCRWCRCEAAGGGPPVSRCDTTECPAAESGTLVLRPFPVPYTCCPDLRPVACTHNGIQYKPGENWTSADDPCTRWSCAELPEGRLERRATQLACTTDCQPGWKYVPAANDSKECCGKCVVFACVLNGRELPAGSTWRSEDLCTNYTCVAHNGTMQVQSVNQTCPEISAALRKQYVFTEEKVEGQCCKKQEPVACRVGNKIYQEGQSWVSSDPCKNVSCERDAAGRLSAATRVQQCAECPRGSTRRLLPGHCCGHCQQEYCLLNDTLKEPGSSWQSADNCTTYTCSKEGSELVVTAVTAPCPDISSCPEKDRINGICCTLCRQESQSLSACAPVAVSGAASVGAVRVRLRPYGACANHEPLQGFYECRGTCHSGTLYNNMTGAHESSCSCCTAQRFAPVDVRVRCERGPPRLHRVPTPTHCACAQCGTTLTDYGNLPTKKSPKKEAKRGDIDAFDYDIPEIYQRMKIPDNDANK